MTDFLSEMARLSAERAAAINVVYTSHALDRPSYPLNLSGFDLIAEIKERSPAEGHLGDVQLTRAERARVYAGGGAAAISVLTEPSRFDGHLQHLEEVVEAVADEELPVMRKDFLVADVQILEAKAAGASGVLLVAAILDDDQMRSMLDCAIEHDLFVLLEAFDEVDLERSVNVLQKARYRIRAENAKLLIGINTRDLRTLAVDRLRLKRFAPFLPEDVICVAESGQHNARDASRVAAWGYQMALVGTSLMRSEHPGRLISDMLDAGRNAA